MLQIHALYRLHDFLLWQRVTKSIQIPSGAVLPTSLLCKEAQKVTRSFLRKKAKNKGWCGLDDRSNPCFGGIFLY